MHGSFRLNDDLHNVVVSTPVAHNSFNVTTFVLLLVFLAITVIAGFSASYFNRVSRSTFAFTMSTILAILFATASFITFIATVGTSFGDDSDKTMEAFTSAVKAQTGYNVLTLNDDLTSNFMGETTTNIGKTYEDIMLVKGKTIMRCSIQNVTLSRSATDVRYLFNCLGE